MVCIFIFSIQKCFRIFNGMKIKIFILINKIVKNKRIQVKKFLYLLHVDSTKMKDYTKMFVHLPIFNYMRTQIKKIFTFVCFWLRKNVSSQWQNYMWNNIFIRLFLTELKTNMKMLLCCRWKNIYTRLCLWLYILIINE